MNKYLIGVAVAIFVIAGLGCNSEGARNVNAVNNAQPNTNSLSHPGAPVSNSDTPKPYSSNAQPTGPEAVPPAPMDKNSNTAANK